MNKIVVGIDGSEASNAALAWAVAEARLRGARVVAVHAWEAPTTPDLTAGPTVDLAAAVDEWHERAARFVAGIVDEVVGPDETVEVMPVSVEGQAAPALIDAALDADLLVVGSRGRGGFAGLLLGSVGQQCAQQASCPVLIHRPS